jgi:glycosyltransferase involved in cell wall biosynthesis
VTPEPLVSVIVPTRDRAAALDACLGALAEQRLADAAFEVVVVDDGGGVGVDDVVARHATSLAVDVHRQAQAGPAAARNAGARQARGRMLAFTDDDCLPAPGWLSALVAALVRTPDALVAGKTVNALERNPYAEASQLLLAFLYAEGLRTSGQLPFATSNNIAVERERFAALGGFDEGFSRAAGEDRDLCDRWRSAGGRVVYEPAARVRHAHQLGAGRFVRQHFAYGRGARRLAARRVGRCEESLRVGSAGFYGRMLAEPFRRLPAGRAAPVAALVALSQLSTALGYLSGGREGESGRSS